MALLMRCYEGQLGNWLMIAGGTMKLPKFWRDKGTWNESAIALCIAASLGICCFVFARFDVPIWIGLFAVPLAMVLGFGIGLAFVAILSGFFGTD